jgi:hypothetical protein
MFYEISKKASLRAKEKFMSYEVTTVYIYYIYRVFKNIIEKMCSARRCYVKYRSAGSHESVFIWIII